MKWSNKVHSLIKCSFNHMQHGSKDLFVSFISVVSRCVRTWYFHNTCQCWTESIFGDSVYSCYCKLWLVPVPPWWEQMKWKFLILITLDCWKRHFWEKNYIGNYFHLLKSTKTTSQKCWKNIIWVDCFGWWYCTNGIKTCLCLLVPA